MIKYQLVCHHGHDFEAWFRCSDTFDVHCAAHLVECPHCGCADISKAVMIPKIARSKASCPPVEGTSWPTHDEATEAEITEVLRRFRAEVEARSETIGTNFAQDARDLVDDEIAFAPVPRLPEDAD